MEDKSRMMEERKRALDEDQLTLDSLDDNIKKRREKLTKLEKGKSVTCLHQCSVDSIYNLKPGNKQSQTCNVVDCCLSSVFHPPCYVLQS